MIKQCMCAHAGQDDINGFQMRVHNEMIDVKAGTKATGYKCTVCGSVKVAYTPQQIKKVLKADVKVR